MFYNFKKTEGQGDELFIEGEITTEQSWWGDEGQVVAREFRKLLKSCGDVTVSINSPGGDVFAAAEIYTALREHAGKVTVKVLGIAASAASVIAMAGDSVLMSPVSYMMIHDPWTFAMGNAREMEHQAQVLREVGEGIIAAYMHKTGKSRDDIAALLQSETYMSAQTAIDEGFADGMLFEKPQEAPAQSGIGKGKKALMRSSLYSPQAICAMLRDSEAQEAGKLSQHTHSLTNHTHFLPPLPIVTDEAVEREKDQRRDIAARAAIIAEICQE